MEPRVSVSQITTFRSSFADDIRAYAAAGLAGVGVWELKLGDGPDDEALELLAASGLESASAVPKVPSIVVSRRFSSRSRSFPALRTTWMESPLMTAMPAES